MKNELEVKGFSALTEEEMMIDGGLTAAQWITGSCAIAGGIVGTVIGGPVFGAIGVKASSAAGIVICTALGLGTGYAAAKIGSALSK